MEPIRNILERIKNWDRQSTEKEILREQSKSRAAQDFGFGPEPGLISYIAELTQRQEAGEAAYNIKSLLWQLAGIDRGQRHTFDTWKVDSKYPILKKVRDSVMDWASFKSQKPFLTLAGPPGTGKTHLAIAATQLIVDAGATVMYRRSASLLDEVRAATLAGKKDHIFSDLRASSFLILDDLGAEKFSDWSLAALDEIVDLRYSMRRHLMVCTNQKSEDLPPRIADRLADKAIAEVIQLAVPSYRRGRG